ncbi:sialic acid-binding Ig-like lectin 14 isoform X1 [Panthera leo]|uniref:sialic acid-binding Ig-like lectin 14 isoform X1 n=1 Tax=Panthera leo TaxID=9689 RepID=UPI001C69C718|nr:sialic acid-binding Ig-like lectin 14 isoform X1 [Panthera leo]
MVPLLLLPLLFGGEDPEYQLRVQESVTVQEGLCVHVPCSFSYPWKWGYSRTMLYIYWFRDRDTSSNRYLVATNNPQRAVRTEARGRFHLVGDPWAYNCSLRIRDAMRSDEGVYFFRVERGEDVRYTYTDTTMTLRVAALTQEPDIHFPEPLKSGWPTELACSLPGSCGGGRPLTFSWVGAALDSLDPESLHSSVLAFTPRPQDHGTNLTCQVKLPEVQATVERTIRLNVSYAPHNLTISIFFSNVTVTSGQSSRRSVRPSRLTPPSLPLGSIRTVSVLVLPAQAQVFLPSRARPSSLGTSPQELPAHGSPSPPQRSPPSFWWPDLTARVVNQPRVAPPSALVAWPYLSTSGSAGTIRKGLMSRLHPPCGESLTQSPRRCATVCRCRSWKASSCGWSAWLTAIPLPC